jgi:hypothetical protein
MKNYVELHKSSMKVDMGRRHEWGINRDRDKTKMAPKRDQLNPPRPLLLPLLLLLLPKSKHLPSPSNPSTAARLHMSLLGGLCTAPTHVMNTARERRRRVRPGAAHPASLDTSRRSGVRACGVGRAGRGRRAASRCCAQGDRGHH